MPRSCSSSSSYTNVVKAEGELRVRRPLERHALEHVVLQPAGAFAQWAVVFSSAEGLGLTERAMGDLVELFGPIRTIVRRP